MADEALEESRRALLWHGVFLILAGLVNGIFVSSFRNPRLALSAHVGGVLDGMLLLLLGLIWRELNLSTRLAATAYWGALYSMYALWIFLVLGAAFGTGQSTPLAGAGFAALPWQETLVNAGLSTGGAASLLAFGIVLHGLRGSATRR